VRVWRVGMGAGLFAILLLIPLYAAANPSGEAPAAAAGLTPVSFPESTSAAPIWIVKMNDDDPMYRPNSVEIQVGQTIEWQNDGQVSHSVTDDPTRANKPGDALLPEGVKPFNSGNVMPGGRYRHTFTQPGRYRYFCLTHEGDKMVGEVIVASRAAPPQRIARSHPAVATFTPSEVGSAAPVQIIRMSDDEPMYRPSSVRISVGEAVEWENDGQVSHSVTDDPARADKPGDALLPSGVAPFNSGNVMPGGRFRHTFSKPGRYRYFCLTHEGDRMVGEVIVELSASPQPEQFARSSRRPVLSKNGPEVSLKVVKMHDDEPMYQPSSIQIVSGQTIEWKNDGQVSHSVSDDPARAWDPVDAMRPPGAPPFSSGNILPGGRFRHTFTEPGRYRYFCRTHEADRMVGEVIVEPANGEASEGSSSEDGLSEAARPAIAE
jgi:plastocyanin